MEIFHRNKNRIVEIDFLRGVLIIFMMVDHLFYDFIDILPRVFSDYYTRSWDLYEFSMNYWNWDVRVATRFIILATFFLISGICCYFSKNNLKRGLIVFIVGLLLGLGFFVFSKIANENMYMIFGAILCFGTSILIYTLLRFLFIKFVPNHKDDFKWIALSLGLLIIGLGLTFDVWNVKNKGPEAIKVNSFKSLLDIILGIRQPLNSADWLPLCPYLGFMLVGSFIGETIYKDKKSLLPKLPNKPSENDTTSKRVGYYSIVFPYKGIERTVNFTGRHSLLFYLLHQVVIILVLCLTFLALGYKLDIRL